MTNPNPQVSDLARRIENLPPEKRDFALQLLDKLNESPPTLFEWIAMWKPFPRTPSLTLFEWIALYRNASQEKKDEMIALIEQYNQEKKQRNRQKREHRKGRYS